MMIRRNTKEFKLIKEILNEYARKKTRRRMIHIYALKPGDKLSDRVDLDEAEGGDILYDMNYQTILSNLGNSGHTLHRNNGTALYYFKNKGAGSAAEFPFELMGKLKKEIEPLIKD